jgi:universal stress protein A
MAYRNILVAVDTTGEAEQVFEAAREIADGKDAKISAITVMRPLSDYFASYYSLLPEGTGKAIEEEAIQHTNSWLSTLAKRFGADGDAVNVVVGKPAAEIHRLAEELGTDLIVIGTHGRHGMGLMLGSTANAVLHGTQCNVLAVRVHD